MCCGKMGQRKGLEINLPGWKVPLVTKREALLIFVCTEAASSGTGRSQAPLLRQTVAPAQSLVGGWGQQCRLLSRLLPLFCILVSRCLCVSETFVGDNS